MTENPHELDGGDLNEADSWPEPTEPPEPDPLDVLDGVSAHEIVHALAVLEHHFFYARSTQTGRPPSRNDVALLRKSFDEEGAAANPDRARATSRAADILALIVGDPDDVVVRPYPMPSSSEPAPF